jgi:hypothetical protein
VKPTLLQIQDYVWMNEPAVRHWEKKAFDKWVAFHWSEGFICVVKNCFEEIAGVVMIRPIMEVMDALDPMKFDPEGRGLHISQIVCTGKGAMAMLGFAALKRFGEREFISWERRKPRRKLIVWPVSVFRRNLFRNLRSYT